VQSLAAWLSQQGSQVVLPEEQAAWGASVGHLGGHPWKLCVLDTFSHMLDPETFDSELGILRA
jgi:hypothetical protein